ncbi:hypothetical protein Poli38472_000576 [Pythium oligandrum]|uniref:Uncharacterized protein n=1 Tax=Pythium oligandrum TaxID=41045 RepID=A0A8K1CBW2_PYTOL|nr:hypothetical protein Poli38472_000576 [Pythium oligandrum]|eukprot:TMW60534.1 hypothetical protein Poli38472_000576 [Pythium oligandrum]
MQDILEEYDDGMSGDELPPIDLVEDLILEAYNNMQSDGEHIFLPQDVAEKLHLVAQMVKQAGFLKEEVPEPIEAKPEEIEAAPVVEESTATPMEQEESNQTASEPEKEDDDDADMETKAPVDAVKEQEMEEEKEEEPMLMAELDIPPPPPSTDSMQDTLTPIGIPTIDEEMSEPESLPTMVSASPAKPAPEPVEPAPPSTADTSLLRKPQTKLPTAPRSSAPRESLDGKTKLTSSRGAPTSATTRVKKEEQPQDHTAYEQRREAAQKAKDDKVARENQVRESARKQREEARRKLEEAQQKELAAKRERVQRMKQEKEQRKVTTRPTTAK